MGRNPMDTYVDNFRANLPAGITYDPVLSRYFCNDRRFLNEWEVEGYLNYIKKYGFTAFSTYAIGSFEPELVFDFEQEYYRTGGTQTAFDSAMTLDRDGNATMHDGTALKWAPHNLVTYSEQFDNAAWTKVGTVTITANSVVAPDGTLTADRVEIAAASALAQTVVNATGYTIAVWVRAGESGLNSFRLQGNGNQASADFLATAEWQRFEFTPAATGSSSLWSINRNAAGDPVDVYIWGAHLYRSDLGGMVDNPDRGDSYVPTTSAARYLARRGHHVYNGAEWVNEGVLVEPSAATNLITYSEDFTDLSWAKNSLTANFISSTNPAGENSVVELVESSTDAVHFSVSSPPGVGTGYYTWSLFAKLGTGTRYIQLRTAGAGVYANFDLSAGAVVDSGGAYIVSANIVDFGNGWYRCVVIGNFGVAPTGAQIIMSNGTGAAPSYLGDGTSSILIFGAQFEQGSVPSSYIPTSGSTVTRAADTLTVPSANLPWSSDAVSIQMEGRATGDTLTTTRWYLDANNYITQEINTSDFMFEQANAGTVDAVTGGSFTSGINVPFNIASRHGSTFVNGAVDGTALTANTTPTALPDLSTTDLSLAYSGGPMILKKVRIFADDIGDSGISEAST